ncbi:MAG: hypothetical protein ACRDVP_04365 [Acidimicrobiales bacterium]
MRDDEREMVFGAIKDAQAEPAAAVEHNETALLTADSRIQPPSVNARPDHHRLPH